MADHTLPRRRALQLLGATGLVTATAGCGGFGKNTDRTPDPDRTPREPPTFSTKQPDYADQFETVVDLAEVGADTDGDDSVVSLLEEHMGDDTLLRLPAGRYRIDATVECLAFENLGIVGDDAVIVPADGFQDYFFDLGRPSRAAGLLFDGITFDFRAAGTGSRPLNAIVDDGLVVRDLEVVGQQDVAGEMLRIDITAAEGTGLVERLRLPDGAAPGTGSTGCLVGDTHQGAVRFADCRIEGFPDNGLYADPDRGTVDVRGGYYANSDIANVRVGNDSAVRGAHIRCDTAPNGYSNMRGIRLTHGRDVLVEDCTIEMKQVAGSDGGISLGDSLGGATVRTTDIRVDANDINAIKVKHPSDGVASDGRISIEDVTISGTAANEAAIEVNHRTECVITGCSIEQRGANRHGLRFENTSTATVQKSRIDVTGRPIVSVDESTIHVVDSHPPSVNTGAGKNDP